MRTSGNIRSMRSGAGMVLFDTNSGDTFSANLVGAKIWNKLQAGLSVEQIVNEISVEFCISPAVVREDAQAFLDSLKTHDLL